MSAPLPLTAAEREGLMRRVRPAVATGSVDPDDVLALFNALAILHGEVEAGVEPAPRATAPVPSRLVPAPPVGYWRRLWWALRGR